MREYWFCVTLSNGTGVYHKVKATDKSDAEQKAKRRVKRLFGRKKITITDVQVKLARR